MRRKRTGDLDSLVRGRCLMRLRGTEPYLVLNRLLREGISFRNGTAEEPFSLLLTVDHRDAVRAKELARKYGHELEPVQTEGYPLWRSFFRRTHLLWAAVLALSLGLMAASLFVWEIRVADNPSDTPDERILSVLEEQGVGIGSFYLLFSEDLIRSRALRELPGLSYLTVNVRGCRAEVTVRPAIKAPELRDEKTPTDIVASHAGVIEKMCVLEGDALVKPGQAVAEGEILVASERLSGTDAVRYVHSRAEITARTYHTLTSQMPAQRLRPVAQGRKKLFVSLFVGRKRINFYSDSGNLPGKCVIIEKIGTLSAPGGLAPALSLQWQWRREAVSEPVSIDREAAYAAMERNLRQELERRLGEEGELLSFSFIRAESDGRLYLTLRAECRQRIDKEQPHG